MAPESGDHNISHTGLHFSLIYSPPGLTTEGSETVSVRGNRTEDREMLTKSSLLLWNHLPDVNPN